MASDPHETLTRRIDEIQRDVSDIRNVIAGSWAAPGVISRLDSIETKHNEMRVAVDAMKVQQDTLRRSQKEVDTAREEERKRRDRRMGQYLAGMIAIISTVVAGLVLNYVSNGVFHP